MSLLLSKVQEWLNDDQIVELEQFERKITEQFLDTNPYQSLKKPQKSQNEEWDIVLYK